MQRSFLAMSTVLLVFFALVAGPARATFPGADGRIAFYDFGSDPNRIGTIAPDGTGRLWLTSSRRSSYSPAWSADGTKLAFVRDGRRSDKLLTVNPDGTGETLVFQSDQYRFLSDPAWSPDGTQIAFTAGERGHPARIAIVDVDGSNLVVIDTKLYSVSPDWSPDGTRIVFVQFGKTTVIKTMDPDGGNREVVTEGGSAPSWAPDGSRIVFTKGGRLTNVFVVAADGSGLTRLTDTPNRPEFSAVFSPDGAQIAFCRTIRKDPFSPCDIWLMDDDGANAARVTDSPGIDEFDLSWQAV
jgi:TolB protein